MVHKSLPGPSPKVERRSCVACSNINDHLEDLICLLFALPLCLGGLGIFNLVWRSQTLASTCKCLALPDYCQPCLLFVPEISASNHISSLMCHLIESHHLEYSKEVFGVQLILLAKKSKSRDFKDQSSTFSQHNSLQYAIDQAQEKGPPAAYPR